MTARNPAKTNKKKILFITGYFPFAQGGAEYQALLLSDRLKSQWEVSFIFRNQLNKPSVFKENGLFLYAVAPKTILGKGSLVFELNRVTRILRRVKPDVIYVRGANAYFFSAVRYAARTGCRIVWHIARADEVTPFGFHDYVSRSPIKILEKKLIEFSIRNSNAIVAQTFEQADLLKQHYAMACDTVIRNWHPIPRPLEKPARPVNLVWVANWKPFKRPHLFVALARRLRHLENVTFTMIGRTRGYAGLAAEAQKEGIEVTGEISQARVNRYLDQSHILVNTSRYEGFSNAFVQAWLRGVPVASLSVDPDGLLAGHKIGICSGSFDQLVEDTGRLVTDLALRQTMSRNSRDYAARSHSLANIDQLRTILNPPAAVTGPGTGSGGQRRSSRSSRVWITVSQV